MITDIDAAQSALRAAEEDVRADMGEETVEAGYADIVEAVAWDCDVATAIELFRIEVGYVPTMFARSRGIDPIDFLED